MFPVHTALISQSSRVSFSRTAVISAALQKQVVRDFSPIWNVQATVDVFQGLDDVPAGYWPIVILDDIRVNAAGIHLDANGQPFALVSAEDDVPLTCSHELLEMLVDPFGDRFVTSDSLIPEQGRVAFLVEVCDPSEDRRFGYPVNGLVLSDFYTPNFFDPVTAPGVRYSFTGTLTRPKQILKNGYISWRTFDTQQWFRASFFNDEIEFENLGQLQKQAGRGWREIIDSLTARPREQRAAELSLLGVAGAVAASVQPSRATRTASGGWAAALTAQIDALRNGN